MKTIWKKDKLPVAILASWLLLESLAVTACNAAVRFNERLAKRAAPQMSARSSGGSYATTDSYLSALEIPEASKQVLTAFSTLPDKDAIVFIASRRTADIELLYRTIASLSWPREMGALHCDESPALLFKPRAEKPIRWLLLYQINPLPSSTVVASIGPHLKLVSVKEGSEWSAYCSR